MVAPAPSAPAKRSPSLSRIFADARAPTNGSPRPTGRRQSRLKRMLFCWLSRTLRPGWPPRGADCARERRVLKQHARLQGRNGRGARPHSHVGTRLCTAAHLSRCGADCSPCVWSRPPSRALIARLKIQCGDRRMRRSTCESIPRDVERRHAGARSGAECRWSPWSTHTSAPVLSVTPYAPASPLFVLSVCSAMD